MTLGWMVIITAMACAVGAYVIEQCSKGDQDDDDV